MTRLLRLGVEVEYSDWPRELIYRGRPFWVSPDGLRALAIPEHVRPRATRRAWRPYDHDSFEQRSHCFHFGPVSQEQMDEFVLPEAPPFFIHTLSGTTRTRVKFGNGYSYGESGSYFFERPRPGEPPRRASLVLNRFIPDAARQLPEPFKTRWLTALPGCKVETI